MEMYGRNSGREGSESDPQAEWRETGLEESMWRLGLESTESYPERVGVSDCVYYMRTGFCGFGSRCRYNHPRDRAAAAAAVRLVGGEHPERPGEQLCQYYLKTGTCKFGASCKFHHPRNAGGSLGSVTLNYHGYPLKPGEKECSYYLKTGQCKFGITCKFHHPQPAGMSMPTNAPPFYPTVQQSPSVPLAEPVAPPPGASTSYRVPRAPMLPGSVVSGAYGPMLISPGVMPIPGWPSSYSGPVSPALSPGGQPSGVAGSVYGVAQLSSSSPTVGPGGPFSPMQAPLGQSSFGRREVKFPERPGQAECQYYLKTGDCKFGSSCKFHHPPERAGSSTACYLNPLGLPLRPGAAACTFYLQNGYCKFGPTCKFDHPMDGMKYSPSASSLAEMQVVPYMSASAAGGGSSLQSLPPSLSSPELSPDHSLVLSSGRDPRSTGSRMSSSTSGGTSSGYSQTTAPLSQQL